LKLFYFLHCLRCVQEMRIRRQQGLEEPPWSLQDEEHMTGVSNSAQQGLVFAAAKQ
jgi:hypothetical protein